MFRTLLFAAALAICPLSPSAAEEAEREPLFPSDDALRDLGALAERWMKDFTARLTPMTEQLRALIDDLDAYQAPERLPNGDIIIRRKPDPAPDPAPAPPSGAPPVIDL